MESRTISLDRCFSLVRDRPGRWNLYQGERWGGSISVAHAYPFVDVVRLEDWALEAGRHLGIGVAMYDAVEADLGRRLVPSPLGLHPNAIRFWSKRLSSCTAGERRAMFEESVEIGKAFGLGWSSIVVGRLDQVFDLEEVAPDAPGAADAEAGFRP